VPAAFKPAYLICGDDHGRIAERRARLRALAERESGASGAELLAGDACTPEAVAGALAAMTFALGRRFIIADGVERWKEKDIESLSASLKDMPEQTTVAFFAREEGRIKAPAALREAVLAAGGEISEELTVKPWELPKWVREQAGRMGLSIDATVARELVAVVGERQQRLLRELEKLALDPRLEGRISSEAVDELASASAERRVWDLADALVARDGARAVRLFLSLGDQGERLPGLIYWVAQRLRLAIDVAGRLEAGEPAAQVRRTLRMPPRAADRFIADVQASDRERLRRALETVADLELDSRGDSALAETTIALRAMETIAA
jgi:DNA polymerase-3 subunit delta